MDVVKLLPLQGAWLLAVYPGRCPGLGASALSGRVGPSFGIPDTTNSSVIPLGVPPDLESGVKKCPNLFRLCGFAIRSKGVCFSFCWGITNPPVLIGQTFLRRISNPPGRLAGLRELLLFTFPFGR